MGDFWRAGPWNDVRCAAGSRKMAGSVFVGHRTSRRELPIVPSRYRTALSTGRNCHTIWWCRSRDLSIAMNVNKPTRTKSQLEALILEKARSLDLVGAVTVRALSQNLAGANRVVVSMNAIEAGFDARQAALRRIVPEIRAQFDLAE
jgi:hypothetical protein